MEELLLIPVVPDVLDCLEPVLAPVDKAPGAAMPLGLDDVPYPVPAARGEGLELPLTAPPMPPEFCLLMTAAALLPGCNCTAPVTRVFGLVFSDR
jgi:hypothetical protein